jgi:Neuraminidase (sialidase)
VRSIPVSLCTGGSYARATDPWVSFSPDGTVHQVVLGVTGSEDNGISGVVVSRSTDGGLTWSTPIEVIRDGRASSTTRKQLPPTRPIRAMSMRHGIG